MKIKAVNKHTIKFLLTGLCLTLLFIATSFFLYGPTNTAHATINDEINFQGKLTNPDGTNVTDGTYTVVFSFYTVSSGGANVWTESDSVTTSNGIFQVNLGAVTTLPGSVNFNSASLYLGIKVGTDAEMTPRIQMTAVPQAFNSDALNGLNSSAFAQLAANQTFTGTNTFQPTTNISSVDILQNSSGSFAHDVFDVQGSSGGANNFIQVTSTAANQGAVTIASLGANNLNLNSGSNTISVGATTILGTGALALQGASGTTVSIGNNAVNNTIQLGTTAVNTGNTQTIDIGNLNAAGTTNVLIGTGASATGGTTTLQSQGILSVGNAISPTINVQTATGGTIGIGNNAVANTVDIANANGANNTTVAIGSGVTGVSNTAGITIGSANAAASTTLIQGGNGATAVQIQSASGGTISIGNGGVANTIQIGSITGGVTETINIGTNPTASASDTVNIGSTIGGTTTVKSAGGLAVTTIPTGGTNLLCYNSTGNILSTCSALSGGAFINNQATVQSANFFVQAATTGTVAGVLQAFNGGAGDILDLRNGTGAIVGSVGSTGNQLIQPSTNSTTALQVQNSTGANILTVDTSTTKNLLPNGDFEGDGTANWAPISGAGLTQTPTQAWQGNNSLSIATTTTPGDGAKYSGYTLLPTTTYTLSLYAKVSAGSITDVNIGRQDNTGTGIVTCLTGQTLTTSWTRFTCSFTTNGTINTNFIYVSKTGGVSETFFIDGVQLQTGASVTAFNAGGGLQLGGLVESPIALQNQTNSANAFQVQNASGNNVLNIDTTNTRINTGDSTVATAVQEWDNHATNLTTLAVSPHTVGNLMAVGITIGNNSTDTVTSVSGGGVSNWHFVGRDSTTDEEEVWEGTVTSPGASTITVRYASTPGVGDDIAAQEFTAGLGSNTNWSVISTNTMNNGSVTTTVTFPSMASTQSGELYWGWMTTSTAPVGPGTPGYTYVVTADGDLVGYNPNTIDSTTYQPTYGESPAGVSYGISMIVAASVGTTLTVNGTASITGANSMTAFQIQGAAGPSSALLTGDTTNLRLGVDVTYNSISPPAGPAASVPTQATITSVTPTGTTGGTSYSYIVIANIATGQSAASAASSTATGNAILSGTNYNAIVWPSYGGATSYNIYRTVGGATTGIIGTVPSGTLTFNDTGFGANGQVPAAGGSLTASSAYKYVVTAIDSSGGETTPSSEVSGTTGVSTKTINVSWTATAGATGYRIYRTAAGGATGSEVYLTTVTSNYFADTGTITAGTSVAPSANTAYDATNVTNNLDQLSIGGNGNQTGQVYVSGTIPTNASGIAATGSNPHGVYVLGNYAYVANFGSNTMQIFDVTNPSNPVSVSTTTTGTNPIYISVQGHYAYVVNNGGASPSLQIFDVSNPNSPVSLGSVVTGASSQPCYVYVQGRYAYVTNYVGNTMQVIDISNPANPVIVGSVAITNAFNVYVQGRYAYVSSFTTNSIQIVDVSNPANPVLLGSASTGTNPANPIGVFVQGRYAYAVNDSTASTLVVIDIANPNGPVTVGTSAVVGNMTSVYVQGRYAYATDFQHSTVVVFDISNPTNPVVIGTISTGVNPRSLYVSGRYAYVVNNAGNTLQVFDLGGTYTQQLQAGGTETGTLQVDTNATVAGDATIQGGLNIGQSLQLTGNLGSSGAVLLQNATNSTTAFQVQNAAGISLLNADTSNMRVSVGSIGTPTGQLYVSGQIASSAYQTSTLASSTPQDIISAGKLIYVADFGTGQFSIYDNSNPAAPISISTQNENGVNGSGKPMAMALAGHYLYTVENNFTPLMNVWDVSNPYAPVHVSSIGLTNAAAAIAIDGNSAYVATAGSATGVEVINISNPLNPVLTTTITTNITFGVIESVTAYGRYLYVADDGSGGSNDSFVKIIDTTTNTVVGSYELSGGTTGSFAEACDSDNVQGPNQIYVQGQWIYAVNFCNDKIDIFKLDTAGPANGPTATTGPTYSVNTGASIGPNALIAQGRYLYATSSNSTSGATPVLATYDISQIGSSVPTIIGSTSLNGPGASLAVDGRYAYAATLSGNSWQTIDLGGEYAQQIEAGGIDTGSLNVNNDTTITGNTTISGSTTIGQNLSVTGNLGSSGSAILQDSTNSTTAFQVQNAAGTSLLTADTANGHVKIGNSFVASSVAEWDGHTTATTLGVAPHNIGDLMLFANIGTNLTDYVTGLSGGGVSNWKLVTNVDTTSGAAMAVSMWEGIVTSTGASNITITYNSASPPAFDLVAQEFTAGLGSNTQWNVTSSNAQNYPTNTVLTYPSLTASESGELYWGAAFPIGTGTVGSSSGFSYVLTGGNDVIAYNANTVSGTSYSPTATETSGVSDIAAVLISAGASGSTISLSGNENISGVNSTTAFQVQSTSGASVLNTDSVNGMVSIGNSTPPQFIQAWNVATGTLATTTQTLADAPHNVGDLMTIAMSVNNSADTVSSVSGGGVTNWVMVNGKTNAGSDRQEIWEGIVTTSGAGTITVTYSAIPSAFDEVVASEFTDSLGSNTNWSVTTSGSIANGSTTTVTWPTLTASQSGELYWGYVSGAATATISSGATAGFTYGYTSNSGAYTYDPNVPAGTITGPTATQSVSGASYGMAMLIAASAGSSSNLTVTGTAAVTGSNSTTAFQIQNASGSNLLTADTTNQRLGVDVTYAQMSVPAPTAAVPTQSATPVVTPTGTTGATTYKYIIIATGITVAPYGNSAASVAGQTTTGNATLSNVNYNALSWAAYSNAAGYQVYRTQGGGSVGYIGYTTATSFNDPGLTGVFTTLISPGGSLGATTQYYYKVTAIDSSGGETTPSTEVNATTGAANAAVTVTLYWPKVAGASGYRIYRTTFSGGVSGAETYIASIAGPVTGTTVTYTDIGQNDNSSLNPIPASNTAYIATNVTNTNNLTLTVGGNGTPTGQLYVSGTVPTSTVGGINSIGTSTSVYVQGHYAYIAASNLIIADISNPASPVATAYIPAGGTINSVVVQGRYAYAANSTTNALQVFDVSNPSTSAGAVGSIATGTNPYSVFVQGRYAYVANAGSSTLSIVDVSNPNSPNVAGSIATGTTPYSVYVQGRYAYVANEGSSTLSIIDVSNPNSPNVVGSIATGTNPYTVSVQGRYAYVANEGSSTLSIIDVSNPAGPNVVGSIATGTNPYTVSVQGRYAYVANEGSSTLSIIDVSNPASPNVVGSTATGTNPYSAYVQGRYAYVITHNSGFRIFDLGGEYAQQLEAGGAEIGTLQVDTNANIAGNTSIQGGLNVGAGLQVNGFSGINGTLNLASSSLSSPTAPTLANSASSASICGGNYLSNATTYYYEIAAVSGSSVTNAVATTPTSVTTGTSTCDTLTWPAVTGATGYIAYRSTNNQTWFSNNVNSSTLGIVDNGTTYTWATAASPFSTTDNGGDLVVGGFIQGINNSGTNVAGSNLTIAGGEGAGTGVGGNINFQIALQGSTGSTRNDLTTAATISGTNGSFSLQNNINVGTLYGNDLFSDNFESGNFDLWSAGTTGAGVTVQSATVHDGGYAFKDVVNNATNGVMTPLNGNVATKYLRLWVNISSLTAATTPNIASFQIGTNNPITDLSLNSSGDVCIYNEVTSAFAGCTSTALSLNAWHELEMEETVATAVTGVLQLWVDGTSIFSSATANNGTTNTNNLLLGTTSGTQVMTFYADDVAVNTVRDSQAASANIDDTLHVGGTADFGNNVQIGSVTATNTNSALLVTNSYNSTTEPTGENGAIYFNTDGVGDSAVSGAFGGTFRCFQNGSWQDCVGMRNIVERRFGYALPNTTAATAFTLDGEYSCGGSTAAATSSGQAESNYLNFATSGVINIANGINTGAINDGCGAAGPSFTTTEQRWQPKLVTRIRVDATSATTNARYWVALSSAALTAVDPQISSTVTATTFAGIGETSAAIAGLTLNHFACDAGNAAHYAGVDMGVAMTTGHYYDIILDWSNSGTLICSVADNGGAFKTVTTTTDVVTANATPLGVTEAVTNITSAATRNISVAYSYLETN